MPHCPHCMTDLHAEATTCAACGAQKGILAPGWTADRYALRSWPLVIIAGMLGFGVLIVAAMGSGIGALLLSIPTVFVAGLAWAARYLIPKLPEKWYR